MRIVQSPRLVLLGSLTWMHLSGSVFAQPEGVIGYDCVEIAVLPGFDYVIVSAMSDTGAIVIQAGGRFVSPVPYVWVNGVFHELVAPPGHDDPRTAVSGISPSGAYVVAQSDVIGSSLEADATLWSLRYPGGLALARLPGTFSCGGRDVNDRGYIVGSCQNPGQAAAWPARATPVRLPTKMFSLAHAINENNVVVGVMDNEFTQRPAMWFPDGTFMDIGPEDPTIYSSAEAVNIHGEAIVRADNNTTADDSLLWRDGVCTQLFGPCTGYADATGINDDGWIIGTVADSTDCADESAALWHYDSEAIELQHLTLRGFPTNFVETRGEQINNANQLVVFVESTPNKGPAFLLTPYNYNLSEPVPGRAGEENRVTVTGLQPGQRVRLAAGFGKGAQGLPGSGCLGGLMLIQKVKGVLPGVTADVHGVAEFVVNVPASLRGQEMRLQAYDGEGCEISHSVDWVWE